MDNIQVGASTIVNAGRGAFASRSITKDSLVAPVPLLQIPDKSILDIYPLKSTGAGDFQRQRHRHRRCDPDRRSAAAR